MIKHIVIWWVIIKHEKYEKHNIKIKYENKRNNRNRNYESIINVKIDKQSIDVRGNNWGFCKCKNEREVNIKT